MHTQPEKEKDEFIRAVRKDHNSRFPQLYEIPETNESNVGTNRKDLQRRSFRFDKSAMKVA